jgi:hypothetical protein
MKQVRQPIGPCLTIVTLSGPKFYVKDEPEEEEMQVNVSQAMSLDTHRCPPGYVKLEDGSTVPFNPGDDVQLDRDTITLIHM